MGNPPEPADFSDPQQWVKGLQGAGFEVPDVLQGMLYQLMEDGDRDLDNAVSWLRDRQLLVRDGPIYNVESSADEFVADAVRSERQQRLHDAWYEEGADGLVVHFPEADGLQPSYGFVYARQPGGDYEEVGWAEGTVTFPHGVPLSLDTMNPGAYGRPFRGLPPGLFDEILCTAFTTCTDHDFEAFADLSDTRVINVGYLYPAGLLIGHGSPHDVSDRGVEHLADLERLEEFSLKSYGVTDRSIAALSNKQALRKLRLCYAAVTAEAMRRLPLEQFTDLTIEFTKTIGPDLSFLKRCSSLENLGLRLAGVTDDQLRHVGRLRQLRHLDLGHNRPDDRFGLTHAVTDRGIAHLRTLADLTDLYLDATKITDQASRYVQELVSLTRLSLNQTAITGSFLPGVGRLSHLETLDLSSTRVSGEELRHLAELTHLKVLRLGRTRVDDAGLKHISQIRSLEHLELNDTRVTARGLGYLKTLPNLQNLRAWDLVKDPAKQSKIRDDLPEVNIEFELDL